MPVLTASEPPTSGCIGLAETVRHFSQRLIAAQRSIRPLDAIQWDEPVEHAFLAAGCRELPRVTRDDYLRRLPFDPDRKQMELQDLERDVTRTLGNNTGVGHILVRMCREYAALARMIAYRGTRTFGAISARLYGSARGDAADGALAVLDEFAERFPAAAVEGPVRDATATMDELAIRLRGFLPADGIRIKLVDRLGADAAAGSDYLKLRRAATYSAADVRLLEVHEGWVHLGTSLNAAAQPVCAFLRKGPPSSTRTQEGLAVLTEFLSGAAHPARVRRLRQRVLAIRKIENGADFLEVFRFLREDESGDREAYRQTARLFRGSLPSGAGPFTKDLCYVLGLAAVVEAVHSAPERLPLLFTGKAAVEDLDTLAELSADGLLAEPRFIPPAFHA
jgi:uncharacterized protein (TIGR02421 family)